MEKNTTSPKNFHAGENAISGNKLARKRAAVNSKRTFMKKAAHAALAASITRQLLSEDPQKS